MQTKAFAGALDWIGAYFPPEESIEITFHGGEPLLAGKDWYRQNLPVLRHKLQNSLKISLQSNLWLLDKEYCGIFKDFDVHIGTSLDGPKLINDAQRGKGYFTRTMNGIEIARRNGLQPGVICTFTRLSAPHYREVFEFFAQNGLSFGVHEAVCTMGDDNASKLTLHPNDAANMMIGLFDLYLENITRVKISTFDSMARGLSAGTGGICTFGDCLGNHLTIGPGGEIFSCNRFAYHPEWQIGSVFDCPSREKLTDSLAWQKLHHREETVREDCGSCTHYAYCKGGCPYNTFTAGTDQRDPHCHIYKRLFDHIADRAMEEVFSEKNMDAVIQQSSGKSGLMRKGPLIKLMKDGLHPQESALKARETVAAVALACSDSPEEAVDRLDKAGIVTRHAIALDSLRTLRNRLDLQTQQGFSNAYIHVTYACNLTCSHCYAEAGPDKATHMRPDDLIQLTCEAAATGFRKVIITGGEPLIHPLRDELLSGLRTLRAEIKPTQLVLRTNLAYSLDHELSKRLGESFDLIVVSIDGNQVDHDARRGVGAYTRTTTNLRVLLNAIPSKKLQLGVVLTDRQISDSQGQSVRELGEKLGVMVRFKPVLPLGRGRGLNIRMDNESSLEIHCTDLATSSPRVTCGLGMTLYIDPSGECYPCYALMGRPHFLGNAIKDGLSHVLRKNDHYREVTVDSNIQCRDCSWRYLCGGFCRAWNDGIDPDSSPQDCLLLKARAQGILFAALETLDIRVERWQSAGMPAPVLING